MIASLRSTSRSWFCEMISISLRRSSTLTRRMSLRHWFRILNRFSRAVSLLRVARLFQLVPPRRLLGPRRLLLLHPLNLKAELPLLFGLLSLCPLSSFSGHLGPSLHGLLDLRHGCCLSLWLRCRCVGVYDTPAKMRRAASSACRQERAMAHNPGCESCRAARWRGQRTRSRPALAPVGTQRQVARTVLDSSRVPPGKRQPGMWWPLVLLLPRRQCTSNPEQMVVSERASERERLS